MMQKKSSWSCLPVFTFSIILCATAWAAQAATLFSPASVPGTPAVADSQQVELGVRFTSDVAGVVTGIRFYKGTTNTGIHIGNLWTSAGTLLGSVTFGNETPSGWQQANFASPISIAANTQYIASYHTNAGNYAFDLNYFSTAVNNPPLHAPATINGVYQYGPGGFPSLTYNASNYWVDVIVATSSAPSDTTPPSVSITAPLTGATISGLVNVSATASDNVGVAGVQFLLDGVNLGTEATRSPYGIQWNTASAANGSHTLTAVARDAAGNRATSTPVTVTVSNAVPPEGPGGPILIITTSADPFSSYYKEILLAEGLNMYRAVDISALTSAVLAQYDVVILAKMPLSAAQANMLAAWVNSGGNLIAMRPDLSLAGLLAVTAQATTTKDKYFLIDTSSAPGRGIAGTPLQFHDTADLYTLNGARAIATLYATPAVSLNAPAVTINTVGTSGGHAAAFVFDLARSVVQIRQGNPAWSGQPRSGSMLCTGQCSRTVDLFYGNASFDPQPDWVDFTNIQIPQADETQRLLANMIQNMLATKKPLPHFWYLPRGEKAEIIMTGDDHGNGGTVGRFQQYQSMSTPGCSVADWQCIRGTSYIYAATPITQAQASAFVADGFEIASHVSSNCTDWTPATLQGFYDSDLSDFAWAFPNLPAPQTNRLHCGTWSDYDTQPRVEVAHQIRFDTNYYYWPPGWVNYRPGLFTGSGLPMRFADRNGTVTDAYQATTQLTDESNISYPYHVNTLLDNATGPAGYYGMFTVNAHTDYASSLVSDAVVNSAITHGVHVISAKQALDWIDGRNASSLGSVMWNAASSTLSFTIAQDARARGLTALIPSSFNGSPLSTLTRNGTLIPFSVITIKGISYAQFASDAGAYQAFYLIDVTPPTVSISAPANGATVSGSAVAVSANASDNVSVAGVQFLLDGVNLGTEATRSPYGIQWNTASAANGSHTLTAVARDAAGNRATSSPITVNVSNAPDTTPPVISGVNSSSVTSSSVLIGWTTNENADSQVDYGPTALYGSSTPLDTTLTLSHAQSLSGLIASTTYHYRVKSRDAAGNLAVSGDFIFVTGAAVRQTIFTNQIPAGSFSDGTNVNYELGMRFTSVAPGRIIAIRFYKSASESGAHTGRIWDAAGNQLASVVFSGETASGWQEQALVAPLAIAANTEYMVSVNTGNTWYADSNTGLASQIASGDLRTIVGGNGRYGLPAAYPTSTWMSSNYFRDIVFTW